MMKWIFGGMIILSVVYAFATGNAAEVSNAALNECQNAVQFLLVLLGSMCLWGGFLKIAERSGLTAVIAKILSPFTRLLFPSLKKDSKALTAISMNITANFNESAQGGDAQAAERYCEPLDDPLCTAQHRFYPASPHHSRHPEAAKRLGSANGYLARCSADLFPVPAGRPVQCSLL